MNTIDWKEQWALHAPDFKEGVCTIALSNGTSFTLSPGPGFGDASHPTTQLMLALLQSEMAPQFADRSWSAFDIGCGSGILSLAAARLGASPVYSVDIEKEALIHTQTNAEANGISLHFSTPKEGVDLVLMNMISSEQKNAWKAHATRFGLLLTSGVLQEEENSYLAFADENGWKLVGKAVQAPWIAFAFQKEIY